jgi:hypothetical protein
MALLFMLMQVHDSELLRLHKLFSPNGLMKVINFSVLTWCLKNQLHQWVQELSCEHIHDDLSSYPRVFCILSGGLDQEVRWNNIYREQDHHHPASFLKSSIKQEVCYWAWEETESIFSCLVCP